jgi:hypothetical protein
VPTTTCINSLSFTTGGFTVGEAHGHKTLALTLALAFASIFGSFTVVLAFTAVNAIAMHLRFFGHYLTRQTGEQTSGGQGQCGASDAYCFLPIIGFPQGLPARRLGKISNLTTE